MKYPFLFLVIAGGLFVLGSAVAAQTVVNLTACGILNQTNTTYVLQNNVSSQGTCFSIQADNITLDLNGKTIIYGVGGGTDRRHGIMGAECWALYVTGNPCGGKFNGLIIKNGKIVQAQGAPDFSHAVRLGQGGGGQGITIQNLDITIQSPASVGIYMREIAGGVKILNNIIHNNVAVIYSRHQMEGMSIKRDGSPTVGDEIYNNTIIGGPQGGILSSAHYSKIYGNTISHSGTYTNDFCIYGVGANSEIYNNTCTPQWGRGILSNSNNVSVHNNIIRVTETNQNIEYGGCQIGGSYGIQHENVSRNSQSYSNIITALADKCDAKGLRVTDAPMGNNTVSRNNTYKAQRVGSTGARAVGFSTSVSRDFVSENDIFEADSLMIEVAWDGVYNTLLKSPTFYKGLNPSPNFRFISMVPGDAALAGITSTVTIQDPIFGPGISKDDFDSRTIGFGGWGQAVQYFINWTYNPTIVDQSGNPVSGATVIITNNLGQTVFNGTTDAQGKISAVLTEFRKYNTTLLADNKENHTPHTVVISKSGYSTVTLVVTINAKSTNTIQLQGGSSTPPPPSSTCANPSSLPSGFATPCPVLSVSASLVSRSSGSLTISATPPTSQSAYIYTTIYISNNGQWLPYALSGSSSYPGWSTSQASLTLSSTQLQSLSTGIHYIASWDWTWNGSCFTGPGTTSCNQGSWRVQQVNLQ